MNRHHSRAEKAEAVASFREESKRYRKYIESLSNYQREYELDFEKQIPRTLMHKTLHPERNLERDEEPERALEKLPSHMHNLNNRLVCGNILEQTLRKNKYKNADYLEPKSTLNDKPRFNVED